MLIPLVGNILVMMGAVILAGSLIAVRQLIMQLPTGRMRRSWYFLGALIVFFIIGYLIYLGIFWNLQQNTLDLMVPTIFFFGAGFVWLTSNLSLQTTNAMRRVALLEQENVIDAMTGIYNRRYLDRRLNEEFAISKRHAVPLSILLIDIDHFKVVNDRHGHQIGDQVLTHLAKLILDTIRHSDTAARYGGEEFMVIAPNTAALAAGDLAERLRHQVESRILKLEPTDQSPRQPEIGITVSVGVATYCQEVNNGIQKLVYAADMALYRAKQAGRNRVFVQHVAMPRSHELGEDGFTESE